MSVYATKADEIGSCHKPDDVCNICGERLWRPFIEWHGHNTFFICGDCARKIRNGLTADLIHCSAIVDLQHLYRDLTFSRESIKALEKEQERKWGPDVTRLLKK